MKVHSFACVCGDMLPHQDQQKDFKCAKCGRVYNSQGSLLWQEKAGNDVPGSGIIVDKAVSPAPFPGPAKESPDELARAQVTAKEAATRVVQLQEDKDAQEYERNKPSPSPWRIQTTKEIAREVKATKAEDKAIKARAAKAKRAAAAAAKRAKRSRGRSK